VASHAPTSNRSSRAAPSRSVGAWRRAPGARAFSEAATARLRHGFEKFDLPEIVSFAVHDNHRSTSVMQRIGMHRDSGGDFDHPRVPEDLPHLKRHVLFRLTAGQWREAVRPAP
jgi:RimJ/RimL family protein N-acetyltransferase